MFKFIEEYRKLNYYGEIFGVSRKFFETNNAYRNRLIDFYAKAANPISSLGQLKKLKMLINLLGYKSYHIEKNPETSMIEVTLEEE